MIKQRNKFWTFIFALIPGAGQMFLGFLKYGISLMIIFFGIIALSDITRINQFCYILPIIWFFSFFDAINKRWRSPEEFSQLSDDYLFKSNTLASINKMFHHKGNLILGIAIIVVGIAALYNTLIKSLLNYCSPAIKQFIDLVSGNIFPIIISIVIILLGVYLIIGKKKGNDSNV